MSSQFREYFTYKYWTCGQLPKQAGRIHHDVMELRNTHRGVNRIGDLPALRSLLTTQYYLLSGQPPTTIFLQNSAEFSSRIRTTRPKSSLDQVNVGEFVPHLLK